MKFKNLRILITGGAGFIGSHLSDKLLLEGAHVTVIDSFTPLGGAHESFLPPPTSNYILIKKSVEECENLSALLKDTDLIFHAAGTIGHLESMEKPFEDFACNVASTQRLIKAALETSFKGKIIYLSSRQVYGTATKSIIDEGHPLNPTDMNGLHKMEAEKILIEGANSGLSTVILRLTNTYGPRIALHHPKRGLLPQVVLAIQNNDCLTIKGGEQVRDFTYVSDVIEACLLAVQIPSASGEIFNLSGIKASIHEVVEHFFKIGKKGSFKSEELLDLQKKIDVGSIVLDSSKFEKISGWKPATSLEEGIKKTLQSFSVLL